MRVNGVVNIVQDRGKFEVNNKIMPRVAQVLFRIMLGNLLSNVGSNPIYYYTMKTNQIRLGTGTTRIATYSVTNLENQCAVMDSISVASLGSYDTASGMGVSYLSHIGAVQLFSAVSGVSITTIHRGLLGILESPPSNPVAGSRYLVAATPSGDWVSYPNCVASWNGSEWNYYSPTSGWGCSVETGPRTYYVYSNGEWISVASRVREIGLFTYGVSTPDGFKWNIDRGGPYGAAYELSAYISANGQSPQFDIDNIDLTAALAIQWNIYIS